MTVVPVHQSLSPGRKPRLPVEIDRSHPFMQARREWLLAPAVSLPLVGKRPALLEGYAIEHDGIRLVKGSGRLDTATRLPSNTLGGTITVDAVFDASVSGSNSTLLTYGRGANKVGYTNELVLYVDSSLQLDLFFYTTAYKSRIQGAASFHDGKRHVISVTFPSNKSRLSLYVDGELFASHSGGAATVDNDQPSVGYDRRAHVYGGYTDRQFCGVIYSYALDYREYSPAEIRALHADPYAPIRKRRIWVPVSQTTSQGQTISGAVQAQRSTASGALTVELPLSGAVQAKRSTTSGTLTRELPISGSVQARNATTSGALTTSLAALSGSVKAQRSTTTGSLAIDRVLTGSVQAHRSTMAGSLVLGRVLSGSVQALRSRTAGVIYAGAPEIIPAGDPKRRRKWYKARLPDGSVIVSGRRVLVERRIVQEVVKRSRPDVAGKRARLRPTRREQEQIEQARATIDEVQFDTPRELPELIAALKAEMLRPVQGPIEHLRLGSNRPWWRDPEMQARMMILLASV